MSCIMGIDVGTSSLKTIVIEEDGTVRGLASQSYQFCSPYNNYAEHEPEEWWNACVSTIKRVMEGNHIWPEEIKAVGFSGQMHGLVTLDKNNQSIRPAILHCDARSGVQIEKIKNKFGEEKIHLAIQEKRKQKK